MPKGLRYNDNGVTFAISIQEVFDSIAAGYALGGSATDPRYIDAVVDYAFKEADDVFNEQAAALARTGMFKHMYEWGTIGVNTGKTDVRLRPESPAARLWMTFTEGQGLDRTIWYAYRNSVATVPKPTKAATGMSTEVIGKMRDHVFWDKARVFEEGETVTIARKKAKWLLIPAYEGQRRRMRYRKNDIKRGYALAQGPITFTPGEAGAYNTFTSFFMTFWAGRGDEILETSVNTQILSDFEPEFLTDRTINTIEPIATVSTRNSIAKKTKEIQKKVQAKARARSVTQ